MHLAAAILADEIYAKLYQFVRTVTREKSDTSYVNNMVHKTRLLDSIASWLRAHRTESRELSDMVTNERDNGTISTIIATKDAAADGPADYERAVSTTGYGTFNVLLVLAALPVAWAGLFDTTTGAFILASAECDLELTFFRKGVLVAFPYIAMTLTTFLWDYMTPYVGMRNLFILGVLADSLLNILSSAVTSYYVFLLVKFLTGILAGGPLAMVMTYLAEFHSTKYKAQFTKWVGLLVAVGNIVPAAIAFMILPMDWHVDIFGRDYTAWRIYLLICSVFPVLGILTACTLPESPKYLMEIGRTDEALRLFRRMYTINTRKSAETFPIKALVRRGQPGQLSRPLLKANSEKIRLAWYNTKQLFSSAYLPTVSYLCLLQFGSMLGFNTLRLWVPHLFVILNNFDAENWTPKERAATMCEMLNRRAAVPARKYLQCPNFDDACIEWKVRAVIYQNSTIIATSAVFFSFLAAMITTTKLRRKLILLTAFLISTVSSFGINWAQSPPYMLTLAASIIVTTRIAGNIVTAVNADVIPIPLRATSIGILTTVGNIGAVAGNFFLSGFLGIECLVAFVGLGCLFSVCFLLSFVQPKPTKPSPRNLGQPAA